MLALPTVPRNIEGAELWAALQEAPVERDQGQYKGWGPTLATLQRGRLILARIATTLLHARLLWVTTVLYPTASERGE